MIRVVRKCGKTVTAIFKPVLSSVVVTGWVDGAFPLRAVFVVAWLLVGILVPGIARAHDIRPAYLEVREMAADSFAVLWKIPADSTGKRPALNLVLPAAAQPDAPPGVEVVNNTQIERARYRCSSGLTGLEMRIDGLETTTTEVLVRIQYLDGSTQIERLTPDQPILRIKRGQNRVEVVRAYVGLGINHILRGVDHLLFVLGLLLIVRGTRRLVKTITAFTIAHSLTLAAATLGWVRVPLPPLNACIALSIFFLGREIARSWRGETSLTLRQPWLVAFAFGLMHGFGFATGLSATGVPGGELPLALLCFNVGVELGQLGFVGAILLLVWSWSRLDISWPVWVTRLPGYSVGVLGAFWTIQRTLMIFGVVS